MGLFDKFFKKQNNDETDAVFRRLHEFLTSDEKQNDLLPEAVQGMLYAGADVDFLPSASGAFGYSETNPIPVNGPIGEITYLSSLRTNMGAFLFAHRLGSVNRMDVFETVSSDGQDWRLMFFDMYHPRKSKIAPSGHTIVEPQIIIGTTQLVPNFPNGMREAITAWTKSTLGIPLVTRQIAETLSTTRFARPPQFQQELDSLKLDGRAPAQADPRIELSLQEVTKQARILEAVYVNSVGVDKIDKRELFFVSIALLLYMYLRYGPDTASPEIADKITRFIITDLSDSEHPLGKVAAVFQERYLEYRSLLDVVFQNGGFSEHDLVTLHMHAIERVSGNSAKQHMIKIYQTAAVLASISQDMIDFSRNNLR